MRFGFVFPFGEARTVAELAAEAEAAGWDGVFYPDGIYIGPETAIYDPWVVLTAVAMRTERVVLGTMLTPPSRRRPWKLARETVSLDHLAGGRLVLPVGLGAVDTFGPVGEATDRATRARMLDESLDILTGLWSGRPFNYQGEHYRIGELTFLPAPVQSPRIPIWVVGAWPRERSMRRALRYDGLLPNKLEPDGSFGTVTADDVRAMAAYVAERRPATDPFEIVVEGRTPGDDLAAAAATVRPFAEAGATWWLDAMWEAPNGPEDVRTRIRQGPPRLE
jgi:alkanesulfonate monooxygenase SsuD/methylene tetrahydromethanopterin reductase-like flavin-dependent oxidoreductase (luciferase family)